MNFRFSAVLGLTILSFSPAAWSGDAPLKELKDAAFLSASLFTAPGGCVQVEHNPPPYVEGRTPETFVGSHLCYGVKLKTVVGKDSAGGSAALPALVIFPVSLDLRVAQMSLEYFQTLLGEASDRPSHFSHVTKFEYLDKEFTIDGEKIKFAQVRIQHGNEEYSPTFGADGVKAADKTSRLNQIEVRFEGQY